MRNLGMLVVVLVACLLVSNQSNAAEGKIVFGAIGSKPQKEIKMFKPMTDYLAGKLGVEVKIVVVKTTDKMAEKIKAGKVDFFMDSPFPAVRVCEKSGAKFILRHWKKGVSEYNSVIYVKTGAIKKLEDLKGKVIAFEDPESTSSCLLPKLIFSKAGIKLAEKKRPTDAAAADEVGYVFSGDDDNTVAWVKRGRVVGGGIKKGAVEDEKDITILGESPMIPRSVVCFSSSMKSETAAKLKAALIGMEKDAAAAAALKNIKKTKKFDEFPKGADVSFKAMKALLDTIK